MRFSFFIAAAIAVCAGGGARAEPLVELARVEPWPAVSQLVAYRGRMWFANSVKFENHNSADIWSYDPTGGALRYETQLFSQDAGVPLVWDGLLWWPFEDPRFSPGRGEFMVTDGTEWRWWQVPPARAFHLHAMAGGEDALYAGTSAWDAALQVSRDRGASWEMVSGIDSPEDSVTRPYGLALLDGAPVLGLVARWRHAPGLLRVGPDGPAPVPGWPDGWSVDGLTEWRGHLYAHVGTDRGSSVWRTDGRASTRIAALDGRFIRDFAAGAETLWAVEARREGGALWRSAEGLEWHLHQEWAEMDPMDVAVLAGDAYVGMIGPGEGGSLWGPAQPSRPEPAAPAPPLPQFHEPLQAKDRARLLDELDALLADPESYGDHGAAFRAVLRTLVRDGGEDVGAALGARLGRDYPRDPVPTYGGGMTARADRMARWYLLWAIAMNGTGRVPPELVAEPWTAEPNGFEKYFAPPPGAMWAAARLGQDDTATLAALIDRLGRADEPLWLVGDAVGALTALTGRRFGYDRAAWRAWFKARAE